MNQALGFLESLSNEISWTDVLDIFLISFLIYKLFQLIRGGRALQMVVGTLLLVLLFFASRWADLTALNWILRNTLAYIGFAVIVLYQQELRRGLANLGRAPLFRLLNPDTSKGTIDEIAFSVESLASRRIGAILVLERDIGLRNYIEGGVQLDAVVTYDLLVAIFNPKSPLHDGAVILQGDRAAAAACFLPISINPPALEGARHAAPRRHRHHRGHRRGRGRRLGGDRPRQLHGGRRARLGARRRAASQEAPRGARAAPGGPRGEAGARRGAPGGGETRLVTTSWTDNMGLKAISLLLGGTLWYAVAREQGAELAFSIPLELRDVPEGLEVIDESVDEIEVRLRGPSEIVRGLEPQDLSVAVDLSDAGPGERVVYLTPEDVAVPFGARVMRVSPASLSISLDQTLERDVNVIPRVSGAPAEGFELAGIELRPSVISVVGPASRVRELEQVTTVPLSAEGLRQPYSRSVRLELDPLVRLERGALIELMLDVREVRERKELAGVRLVRRPDGVDARIRPEAVSILVEGPKSLMEELSADEFEAELHLDGLASGRHQVVPMIHILRPEVLASVHVVSVTPEEIRVDIP